MRSFGWSAAIGSTLGWASVLVISTPGWAESALQVVYPPDNHQTVAEQIFFIGTASPAEPVLINGQVIDHRSPDGHFAPSLPLQMGENIFTLTQGERTLTLHITRLPSTPQPPEGITFGEGSLTPTTDIARQPGEPICFSAIAPAQANVAVDLANQRIPLQAQDLAIQLPLNSAVLTDRITPETTAMAVNYQGCGIFTQPGQLGKPEFHLSLNGTTVTVPGAGSVEILSPQVFWIAEVTAAVGTARTGPSTDYSRLTPLPQGTRAQVTGREGEWLRLDYGAWIRDRETRLFTSTTPPQSIIRGVRSRQVPGWTEVLFPLQVPVPITIDQTAQTFTLTLHNTTPQTDTIFVGGDAIIQRMDWHPVLPNAAQYTFTFRTDQQWGYKLRYEGTTLVLSLRHPPALTATSLAGATILIDPGHGSAEDLGARGPTGYPEKDVTLIVSKLLRDELVARGARVIMTREGDDDIYPNTRTDQINQVEPTLALSLHYNALPDDGDALNTAGIGNFWYHAQAQDLAAFLHDYLITQLDRPSYGVFWNNLALTRPHVAPSVLLELGFMINPNEFEWITDPTAQQELAHTLADGIEAWLHQALK